jgi:hypothetical protein
MLLYERLIGPNHPRDPALAPMREDFAAAVLVVVDNVAHFYFESPQEEWHLARHFPNIAPPWPKAFYEYRLPRFINLGKELQLNRAADSRVGLLLHSNSIEEVLSERRARRGDRPLSAQEREELSELFGSEASSLVWGTADPEAYERANVGWLCYAMVIFEAPHREPKLLNTVYFAVSRQGEIVLRSDGRPELVVNIPDDGDPAHLELRRSGASSYLHVPLLATCFSALQQRARYRCRAAAEARTCSGAQVRCGKSYVQNTRHPAHAASPRRSRRHGTWTYCAAGNAHRPGTFQALRRSPAVRQAPRHVLVANEPAR